MYEDMTNEQLEELKTKLVKQRRLTGGHGKRAWMTLQVEKIKELLDKRAQG